MMVCVDGTSLVSPWISTFSSEVLAGIVSAAISWFSVFSVPKVESFMVVRLLDHAKLANCLHSKFSSGPVHPPVSFLQSLTIRISHVLQGANSRIWDLQPFGPGV